MMEAAEADIVFAEGKFAVAGTDKAVEHRDVARAAFMPASCRKDVEAGLFETGTFDGGVPTFPNGCHICEIEIDEETGAIELVRYIAVDEVGTSINPLLLQGQVHGGIAQGVGQA